MFSICMEAETHQDKKPPLSYAAVSARGLPVQAERKLDGQWKLVYTSNSELFGLLALSRLPFVMIGDITQTVQASTLTVENKVRPRPVAFALVNTDSMLVDDDWCGLIP